MTLVFMFPGQSSRYPEMVQRLIGLSPVANGAIVDLAADTLGRDLRRHYRADNPDIFATNRDVQVGVFLTNHLFLESLRAAGIVADRSLGASLGEYNHLVEIGALEFGAALLLVDARGIAYDSGPGGAMASVSPLELDDLRGVVGRAAVHGTLEIANLNSPTQHVISGERAAVEAALNILEEEFYVPGVVIEPRIPMHSSRFAPVAAAFRTELERAPWKMPQRPYLPNVYGHAVDAPSADDLVEALSLHVHSPVLWRASLEVLTDGHPDAVFVEVGPRAVLHNLLGRKWLAHRKHKTDGRGDLHAHFAAVVEELSHAC